MNFRATRAPSADAAHYTVPYFVAITQGDQLIEKRILQITFDFGAGDSIATFSESPDDFDIHVPNGHQPFEYEMHGGLPDDAGAGGLQQENGPLRAMTSLAANLSRAVGDAFAAEGLGPALRPGASLRPARPGAVPVQWRAGRGESSQSQSSRHCREDCRAAEKRHAIRQSRDRRTRLYQSRSHRCGARCPHRRDADAPPKPNGKTLLLDFGGPNVAKPMHVGHLRSSIIGDCLQRLFRANGWQVMSDVHLGDWGLQMGQLISEIGIRGIAPIYFDAAFTGPYPEQSPVTMEDLEEIYPAASAACKADPARLDAARRATVELQDGRPGYRALWRHFVDGLGSGRSSANSIPWACISTCGKAKPASMTVIAPMIEDLKARGLAEMSEGALVIEVAQRRRQEADAAADSGQIGWRGALRHDRSWRPIIERRAEQNPDLDSLCGGSPPAWPFRAGFPRRRTRPALPARRSSSMSATAR